MTDGRIDASLRNAPVMDRSGYQYVIHPLLDGVPRVDPGLLLDWAEWAASHPDVLDGVTVLLAPEAMGVPLAVALSMRTGIPYLVVRKREYGLEGEAIAYCETGYSQTCLYVNGVRPDDRVLLVDDIVSTGGTLEGIVKALGDMDVDVAGALVFAEKDKAAVDLAARIELPVRAMRRIHVAGGLVDVEDPTGGKD